jgi:hypothetical protein
MTEPEPDPVAALAAQLEELRGQLARSQGEVGQVRARMEEFAGQDMVMLRAIKDLGGQLAEVTSKREADDPQAPFWLRLDDQERQTRLGVLRDWVERFLRAQYPRYLDSLPPCWENHPEAVWELSNLMTEWVRIYGAEDSRPLQDALIFHDRWLPGVLNRLAQAYKCDRTGCRAVQPSSS